MFKRIKNLLDISRYTVEELKNTPTYTTSGYSEIVANTFRPATIITMTPHDPLKDFEDETTEQSSNDSASRNG